MAEEIVSAPVTRARELPVIGSQSPGAVKETQKIPEYRGSGDPTLATSFRCVTDERTDFNETPAPQYGP
jgi:hypothetical protein